MQNHLTLALLATIVTAPALRAETIPAPGDLIRAELLPGWREPDGRHFAALHLRLAPQWKTYWRAPGDAGIPPQFDWSGSENLGRVTVHWPRPTVFDFEGMTTIGYLQDVVLPVEVEPQDPSRPMHLQARVDLGICKDVCVPAEVSMEGALPAPGAADAAIAAALAARPLDSTTGGIEMADCSVAEISDGLQVTARLRLPPGPAAETVVMEPGAPVWVSDSTVSRDGNLLTAVADMVPGPGQSFTLDPAALRLTVLSGSHAVELIGCPLR